MQFIPVPDQAYDHVQIDILGPFTRTAGGNKYVITAICYLSKWIEAKAVKDASTIEVAKFLTEQIICRHGCPKILQSDQGSHFTSELLEKINHLLGIDHQKSTSYHPESQGLVEKSHNTLTDCISMYVSSNQRDWDLFISHLVFAYNTSVQKTTKMTPFSLVYGREAKLPAQILLPELQPFQEVDDLHKRITEARQLARTFIENEQRKYADRVNAKLTPPREFAPGEEVVVRKHGTKKGLSAKLMQYFVGPYTVVSKSSPVNYVIEYKQGRKTLRKTVHVDKLKPYVRRTSLDRPIITDGSDSEDDGLPPTRASGNTLPMTPAIASEDAADDSSIEPPPSESDSASDVNENDSADESPTRATEVPLSPNAPELPLSHDAEAIKLDLENNSTKPDETRHQPRTKRKGTTIIPQVLDKPQSRYSLRPKKKVRFSF